MHAGVWNGCGYTTPSCARPLPSRDCALAWMGGHGTVRQTMSSLHGYIRAHEIAPRPSSLAPLSCLAHRRTERYYAEHHGGGERHWTQQKMQQKHGGEYVHAPHRGNPPPQLIRPGTRPPRVPAFPRAREFVDVVCVTGQRRHVHARTRRGRATDVVRRRITRTTPTHAPIDRVSTPPSPLSRGAATREGAHHRIPMATARAALSRHRL